MDPERKPLVMADCERFCADIFEQVAAAGDFDLLTPMPRQQGPARKLERDGVDPQIPWLYNFKLNFRFQ